MELRLNRLRRKLGFAGSVILILVAFVGISLLAYHLTGLGEPPQVGIRVEIKENDIVVVAENGSIAAGDWEYKVYSVVTNPPSMTTPTYESLEPGKEVVLRSDVSRGTYKVQIFHKPSSQFIHETELEIEG